jgi:hypothetical protein
MTVPLLVVLLCPLHLIVYWAMAHWYSRLPPRRRNAVREFFSTVRRT